MSDIQKEYFNQIQSIVPHPLKVARLKFNSKLNDWKPGIRQNIDEVIIHDERNVADNEIIFDLDFSSYKQNYSYAVKIIDILTENNIPHYIFCTGGKGIIYISFLTNYNLNMIKQLNYLKKHQNMD